MKQWSFGVFIAILATLSLSSAWWQHHIYATDLKALELQRDALKLELEDQRRKVAARDVKLGECRSELAAAKEARRSSETLDVEAARHLTADRDKLQVERNSLASDLRGCKEAAAGSGVALSSIQCPSRLAAAAQDLRRLREATRQRALSSRASRARLLTAGRALAARVRAIKTSVATSLVGQDSQFEQLLRYHLQQMQHIVEDMGLKVNTKGLRSHVMKKLAGNVPVVSTSFPKQPAVAAFENNTPKTKDPVAELQPSREGMARQRAYRSCVAAVVPFRGRRAHLEAFTRHIATFLASPEASRLCWSFYIVEQYDADLFNRGWLFNVGLAMAGADSEQFRCVVIQDLDTLPEPGAGVDFSDCSIPTQLSSEIQCYDWLPPYAENAGGVVAMKPEHWYQINGFANDYEGWGGEDDDLRLRLKAAGLLRGTCGSFCNLTDRGFIKTAEQSGLMHRPARGRGRFICLDEGSHTPRKHGDIDRMHGKLQEMQRGSTRWTKDGLSDLRFDLLTHWTGDFPGAPEPEAARLHWVRVVPVLQGRFGPERVRLVLAGGACPSHCREQRRCEAAPSTLPTSMEQLDREVHQAFHGCLGGRRASDMFGYWLVNRHLLVTPLHRQPAGSGDAGARVGGLEEQSSASWRLSEALRVALSGQDDGEPVLAIRAVPSAQLEDSVARFKADPRRMQQPLTHACVGTYEVGPGLGVKHTVNVGSDDCEQRSWTHFSSFQVLRQPRSSDDQVICTGEANGTWTMRVDLKEDCSGTALGIAWNHKFTFYIGRDAAGPQMCVMYRQETGRHSNWSRWMVAPKGEDGCAHRWNGYKTAFVFRSMQESYQPPRIYVCAGKDERGRLQLHFDCERSSSSASFAVLRGDFGRRAGEIFCIGRSTAGADGAADKIDVGSNCTSAGWRHVASFAAPADATGRAWCVGRRDEPGGLATYSVAPEEDCGQDGFRHELDFREVALVEMSEESGLMALDSL